MRLRLAEADRERLNCPEFLPLSLSSITNREAIVIKRLGFTTPRMLAKALGQTGQYEAWTAAVWLALKRAGVNVDVDSLEFDVNIELLEDEPDPEPVELESGKAEEAPEASPS